MCLSKSQYISFGAPEITLSELVFITGSLHTYSNYIIIIIIIKNMRQCGQIGVG